ncbi:GNAT family N-acetyltransferase [Chthonobacter albigriseus]|uniref:GNAT family N-acetyltransferase n=1 Tax=Chthonobacter albigriseus TaxID=1683161 RepID=UPI0015EE7773|nr:GNAT family protein [Chthonobacter albigriseus]
MTLLRVVVGDTGPTLRGEQVFLRAPQITDYVAWAELRETSRGFLKPWEPSWPADDLTRTAFKHRVKRYHREIREDLGYTFFVFRSDTDQLMGGVTLSNVRRGVTQTASLGYWMGERHAGKGHMTDAVRTLLPHAFDTLRLHRIEAASMPHNDRSIHLLEKVGFRREGFARRYLLIDGRWQDHVLFAVLADDPRPARRADADRDNGEHLARVL